MGNVFKKIRQEGLYDPSFEHDNCGIGAIIDVEGRKSHRLVDDALSIVENLEHRAGKDAEGKTGDGVGILTQIPHRFFVKKLKEQDVLLPGERQYGVGMFFFPQNDLEMRQARSMFEVITRKAGIRIWRSQRTGQSCSGRVENRVTGRFFPVCMMNRATRRLFPACMINLVIRQFFPACGRNTGRVT